MDNAHACYPQEKWSTLYMASEGRERSISETEQFQRKRHKYFDLRCPLSRCQRFHDKQAPEVRCDLNTHTHGNYCNPPAHARRGLIKKYTCILNN